MNSTVRPERPEDHQRITEINDLAFGQPDEGALVARLRRTEGFVPGLSLVAGIGDMLVGHILFYPIAIESDGEEHRSLALAPMSVAPEFQRKGVGGELVAEGLRRARDLGYTSVIVVGHAEYYPRFGFERASKWGIRAPFDAPDEAFLALELVPGALEDKTGTVRYPEEFEGG
jgi:putative acetyltransferase